MVQEKKKKRTLDELFAKAPDFMKQGPRDNYVEANSEEQKLRAEANKAALEESYARTDDSKSGAIEIVGAVPPKEEPPAPEIAPKRIPKNIIPPEKEIAQAAPVKEEAPKEGVTRAPAKKESSFPWDRLLIGATPLLTGLLTGNQLEGVQTSSDYFVEGESDLNKRKLDLDQKLAEMQANPGRGGKRRYQRDNIEIEDPTAPSGTRTVKAIFDSFEGGWTYPDKTPITAKIIKSGYSQGPDEARSRIDYRTQRAMDKADYTGQGARVNQVTGETEIVRNGRWVPIEGGAPSGKLNVRQEDQAKELRTEFRQNPVVKRVLPVAAVSQQLQDLLNSGKPVSQRAAATSLARMSGEVGNLSEMEQEIYTGSPSINARIKRWTNLQATDAVLQPHEVEDLRSIAIHYGNASRELLDSAVRETKAIGSQDYGLPQDTVDRLTSPIAKPLMEQMDKGAEKARPVSVEWRGQTVTPEDRSESLAVEINGELFWTADKWEDVKKEHPSAKRLN